MIKDFKYLSALDGLRGVSIIQVLLFHLNIYHGGTFMIQGFMVQSGYLITVILLKNKERSTSKKECLKVFHSNRLLRILPLYFLYIFTCCLLYLFMGKYDGLGTKLLYLFSFNYNNYRMTDAWSHDPTFTHLWTISMDMHFYLLWPFVVLFLDKKWVVSIVLCLVICGPLIRFGMGELLPSIGMSKFSTGNSIYTFTFSHFDAFVLGSLIPYVNWDKYLKTHFIPFVATISMLFAGGLLNYYLSKGELNNGFWRVLGYPFSGVKNLQHVWNYSLANLFFMTLIIIISSDLKSRTKTVLKLILELKPFSFLGRYTYGIYIFHGVLITISQQLGFFKDKPFSFIFVFGFSILLSMLSFHYYEAWFLKKKRKLGS